MLKKLFVARAVGVNFAGRSEGDRDLNSPRARESRRSEFPVSMATNPTLHEKNVSARASPAKRLLGGYLHPLGDAACRQCPGCISSAGS